MYPVIADFGRIKLYSYGLMLFFAFLLGLIVAHKRGKAQGLPEGAVLDLSTLIVIFGLLGARILYVVTHIEEFQGRWLDIINPIQSDGRIGIAGLVLLGGVIAGVLTTIAYTWLKNLSLLHILDVFAPSLALGIGIGRIGCFLNGCCFGLPTELPWGVVFPSTCLAGSIQQGVHIHPTQLYAVLYSIALFFLLIFLERRFKKFDGFTFSLLLIFYGTLRFFNEMLRWHEEGLRLIQWSTGFFTVSQVVSFFMVVSGVVLYIFARRIARESDQTTS